MVDLIILSRGIRTESRACGRNWSCVHATGFSGTRFVGAGSLV